MAQRLSTMSPKMESLSIFDQQEEKQFSKNRCTCIIVEEKTNEYRVTKELGDTYFVDLKMRFAS